MYKATELCRCDSFSPKLHHYHSCQGYALKSIKQATSFDVSLTVNVLVVFVPVTFEITAK